MLTELGKKKDTKNKNFNKELKHIKKNRAPEYNNWNEEYIEGINSRLGDTEKHMRNLEERIMQSPSHK